MPGKVKDDVFLTSSGSLSVARIHAISHKPFNFWMTTINIEPNQILKYPITMMI